LVVGGGPVLGALYHDHSVATMSGDRMEASWRGRPRGEDGGAAEDADDEEPVIGGEVAREQAGDVLVLDSKSLDFAPLVQNFNLYWSLSFLIFRHPVELLSFSERCVCMSSEGADFSL
jgi:hypothetical protein